MNQPFASASNEKCSPPASPAFAYFAKVLARFSENNFFVAFRHQGLPFLAFRCPCFEPAKESSAPPFGASQRPSPESNRASLPSSSGNFISCLPCGKLDPGSVAP